MPDIKTRDIAKGTIKTIDKSAVAAERMKSAFILLAITRYSATVRLPIDRNAKNEPLA